MLQYRFDIIVRDRAGNLAAIAEVKNPRNFDAEFAAILRRNVLEHAPLATIPFLLVTSQDIGYLWKDTRRTAEQEPPIAQIVMAGVLSRYVDLTDGRRMSGDEVALRIQLWLNDLSAGLSDTRREPEKTLEATGFLQAVLGGIVLGEVGA